MLRGGQGKGQGLGLGKGMFTLGAHVKLSFRNEGILILGEKAYLRYE